MAGCLLRVSGPALWERMQNSWGYLATGGYNGHVFPVVIGETGSQYLSVCTLHFYHPLAWRHLDHTVLLVCGASSEPERRHLCILLSCDFIA